jgi:hypothetical protein
MVQLYSPTKTQLETSESARTGKEQSFKSIGLSILAAIVMTLVSTTASAQLGIYEFTGAGTCPNQNPAVTSQPSNAVFSNFSNVNANCTATTDQFVYTGWNTNTSIDLSQYHEFTITANSNYVLNLTSLSFTQFTDDNNNSGSNGTSSWALRSSIDNYAGDIATGTANTGSQTPVITLPATNFSNVGAVTFRFYLINAKDNSTSWAVDDVTLNGTVAVAPPADPANPGSNSPQCSNPGVTILANGTAPAGETWYWQTIATGTSTANSASTYTVTTSGTYYIRSQNNTTLAWSNGAGSITVTITPDVSVPVFSLGATSTRCQAATNVTYTASAANTTGITYSLDAASISGGNSINAATGTVTYAAGWSGTTVITASAAGCSGPKTAIHTVTITPAVTTPVFALGSSSFRCLGGGSNTYSATTSNATSLTYSLDALSLIGGNSINSSTGTVTFSILWVGTTTITATANGVCGGPKTATHTVTINIPVSTPSFALGSTSSRCQAAGIVTYTATAANSSSITYSLDAASIAGGNTINSTTGDVTFAAGWSGTSIITASAAGCSGPKTATHTVTTNAPVATPVFTLGATTSRCQAAGTVTYTATASNSTGITYSLDATSIAAGNSINSSTGVVAYVAAWTGTSIVTASATGCSGPKTSTHTVTITATVGTPLFTLGTTSTRCQATGTVTYTATATNTTGITYSLDAASIAAGNTINASTGVVTYATNWSGTSIITASAAGCNGPKTSTHTATITATVGTPVFSLGSSSTRLQGAGTITYDATATNSTGIIYSLDAASIAAGNTINASTGAVTYVATWTGTTTVTASTTGCNGPKTATHTVNTNSTTVIKQLYLSDPSQALDRVDPVNTADATISSTTLLTTSGTTSTTFTMAPALCDSLVIKAGTITIKNYVTVSSGAMPANPAITAVLKYGSNTIITINNPVYSGGILTWTATLGADVTVPAGQAISFQITTAQAGVTFRIDYDSQTKPSKIDLPVSTFINILSLDVYTAAYPAGSPVTSGVGGATKYIRVTATDPFGSSDITAMSVKITPTGTIVTANPVGTSGCTRTFEYVWTTPSTGGNYVISATAKEGYENTVTNTKNTDFNICSTCSPIAVDDSASGAGGNPIIVDVLANDYDPNNNINVASLAIVSQPKNGSAYISNNTVIYLPNGTYQGNDTITYQVCDQTTPTALCATAQIFFTINPLIVDICGDASKTHTYYIPYPEQQAYTALKASTNASMPSNTLRTIISIKVPYSGMTIVWDEWEDGYEANPLNPTQSTTKVWGDGNPFNGIAPGYPSDIIPASGNIVLDNTMNANPRNATIYYDGRDKVVANGQLAITQVTGEPTLMPVQAIKTNVTSTYDFGQSFTIPLGQDFNSQDFKYTALFVRASQNNTTISIDKDNNGSLETVVNLNEGESYLVNGGVLTGATVTSDKPVGVELNAGGVDQYSIRNAPIYPATWYSNVYYTPVPTSDNPGDNPKDSSAVMFYNSLNRPININWYSGAPANGVIAVPAKSAVRFPLAYSTTATYKFVNLTGESFTAIEMVDSYTPGGGGNDGSTYDWSFNLISDARLTDYTTVAWAPGGLDLTGPTGPDVNGNPIWVTPTANTTIYVKYDGNVNGTSGSVSPCGLRYDVAYTVNALNYIKIKDATDNDQSGIAIYTCNGAKIAAVYGEDPQGASTGVGVAYWDVGSTLQPFCKEKLVVASDDYVTTLVSQPVTVTILDNDFGFLATVDPANVSTLGLLQPQHGTTTINADGSILYTPNPGYSGLDTFQYRVCSTPSPIVCDDATVVVKISTCPSNGNQNIISGQVFVDRNKDASNNDGGQGLAGVKIYLYTDGNCSGTVNANELTDSVTVDNSGYYQFVKYPEKTVEDDFNDASGASTCATGSDGDSPWSSNWTDSGDPSTGFCNNTQSASSTDVEIVKDGSFGYALRLKDNNVSAMRSVNLNGALKAFLTFSYRRKSTTFGSGENVLVQASNNGSSFTTIYTIAGTGATDAGYVTVYNQDISSYASSTTAIRFLTDNNMSDNDTVYIDNVSIRYLKYPQCYITAVATSSIPAFYTVTTASQKSMTISSGGTCTSNYDFGLAKNSITISGTLYNDKNGLMDGTVNGGAIGIPGGSTVYAYLVDNFGKVAYKATVSSSNGTYNFPLAEVNTTYMLVMSTSNVALGANSPASASLPSNWVSVGDAFGTNNGAGSGNKSGTSTSSIPVKTATINITNINFGIDQLPNSDSYLAAIGQPRVNQFITMNGGANPPVLSGTDPEDCNGGCVLTAHAVIIDQVPVNAELYYNGSLVVDGQQISNFNPALFQVKITAATLNDTTISFNYSYVDAATMKDPIPAMYKLIWLVPLPADGLIVQANLDGTIATIKWTTLSEQNTSHYVVERSVDNVNFAPIGSDVPAAGNSTDKREYQLLDNISGLMQSNVIFYRVKLVDLDGKTKYSSVVTIRLSSKPQITIWPNPFQSALTINMSTTQATSYDIKLMDINGKLLRSISRSVARGASQITVQDLERLPSGIYLIEMTDEKSGTTTMQKLIKK